MTLADIQINPLTPRKVDYQLYAPGEILSNGYTSYRVSPRVPSVVLRRHVALGDHVEQGHGLLGLVGLQRTDQPQFQSRQTGDAVGRRYLDALP